jgi:hypothetical protein
MKALLDDISRLQRFKARGGIRIAQSSSLTAYKQMSVLKKDIDSSYKLVKEELESNYKRTGKRSVEDWLGTIPVMKALTFNKVRTIYQEEGILALILTFVPHTELTYGKDQHTTAA